MKHLAFFLQQARASLGHNRQRTVFVLFCVAVGVAAVVSLRSVGLMIADGLTQNLQVDNRGDISVSAPIVDERISDTEYDETLVEKGGEFAGTTFSQSGLERIRAWAAERGIEMQRSVRNAKPLPVFASREEGESATTLIYFVEADRYPFYGELTFVAPGQATLADVLTGSHKVAISARLAKSLEVGLGDDLHIRGTEPFVVAAIIEDSAEARLREMQAVVLPTLLVPFEAARSVFNTEADTLYLKTPQGADTEALAASFREAFVGTRVTSTEDLRRRNAEVSGMITRLITTLGLVSLLIGGIGIANTMAVNVGRRTLEIGVLKTIGLQGRQITLMFLVEALIFGFFGSLLGVLLGVGLLAALQGLAEQIFVQTLRFQVFPEAIVMGLVTGVLVTLVFGFLPTLAAGRVRPSVVLQPDRAIPPRTGAKLALIAILALTGVIGVMVGLILERMGLGIVLSYVAVVLMGLMIWVFRGIVAIVGRLPAMGNTYLRLTQRAIQDHPGRTASTLLALVVGMFALSSILLMTGTLLNVIDDALANQLGGDVVVIPENADASSRAEALISGLDGLEKVRHQVIWGAKVVAIDGNRDLAQIENDAKREAGVGSDATGEEKEFDEFRFLYQDFMTKHSIAAVGDPSQEYTIGEGRDVAESDRDKVVIRGGKVTRWLGLDVGSTLVLAYDGGGDVEVEVEVEVVGLIAPPENENFNVDVGQKTHSIASPGVVPDGEIAQPTPFLLTLEDGQEDAAIRALSEQENIFVLPVSLVNKILTGLFEKLTALPLVVAFLALFASSVIIANTVSLSVLERRRQIGVMKAIGLHSRQVLGLLLLENGLVGLLGGLIGTGISALMIWGLGVLSESPGSFPVGTLLALVALAVVIALAATLVTARPASREKPLIVLRYE